jgi:hypothetical protein
MTYQTCEKLAAHFRALGREEEAREMEARAARKKAKKGIIEEKPEPIKSNSKK